MTGRWLPVALLCGSIAACGGKQDGESSGGDGDGCEALFQLIMQRESASQYLVSPLDTNGDCEADLWKAYELVDRDENVIADLSVLRTLDRDDYTKRVREQWLDLNFDGMPDVSRYYDARERLERVEYDVNFDELVDIIEHYRDGRMTSREVDFGNDGRTETVRYYRSAELFRIELDEDGDGQVDTWHFYDEQGLARVGRDSDGDGNIDRWERRSSARRDRGASAPAAPGAPGAAEGSGE